MKFSRLWQPHNPAFWLMVVVNLLSTALAWIVRNHSLATPVALVIAVFAVGNAVIGLRLMWLLVRDEPSTGADMPKE